MPDDPTILLTNDDGIDAPGLRAARDALERVGDVTVVAPASEQSAVGRSLSYGRTADGGGRISMSDGEFAAPLPHEPHDLGTAVRGTPCDCVIAGVNALESTPDLVVAGCNPGANIGAHVLPRSGTASAAMEAAALGVPAVALSMDTLGHGSDLAPASFAAAAELGAALAEHALDAGVFDAVDYLNVNAPHPDAADRTSSDAPGAALDVAVTEPSPVYEMDATREDDRFLVHNRLWEGMADGDIPDPEGTDRHAILAGRASVSPLAVPHEFVAHSAIEAFADEW